MKRFFYFIIMAAAAAALSSCSASYRQIATVSSPQLKIADDGTFSYRRGEIVISYDFWAESGRIAFLLTNESDQDIYVDLTRSFLVFNGLAYDYFNNRSFGTSLSTASSVTTSRTSSSTQSQGSGNATGNGNWGMRSGGGYAFGNAYDSSSAYASMSTNYNSSSTTSYSAASTTRSVEYREKEGVWVPAHSSRVFDEFSIMSSVYRKCGLPRNPDGYEEASVDFTMGNSPVTFENRLMIVVDGQPIPINNTFFISNVMNVNDSKAIDDMDIVDCNNRSTKVKVQYNIFRQANKFYLHYMFYHNSGESDDRISGRGLFHR